MKRIAITGANGLVGRSLTANLDPNQFAVTPLDLPQHDATDLEDLVAATKDHDAIVHLAWYLEGFNSTDVGVMNPNNNLMTFNVYEAARRNGIGRVVMASSNHAQRFDRRDADGRLRASIAPAIPDSVYGAEKLFMEALGRYYATAHDLGVVCVRIGNVNEEDRPKPDLPDDPVRWLSHADLGRLVTCSIEAPSLPDNFDAFYGVSRQEVFDWSNSVGYEPQDSAI